MAIVFPWGYFHPLLYPLSYHRIDPLQFGNFTLGTCPVSVLIVWVEGIKTGGEMRLEVILTIRFSEHSPPAPLDYSFCTPLEYLCAQVVSLLEIPCR